jgi:cation:H+ antiporter
MVFLWLFLVFAGFGLAVFASTRAVTNATELARSMNVPPFVLGVLLISVGTDMPEIANSIIASVGGHGDVNVGDSIGSCATQLTLVLGLVPLVAGPFDVEPRRVGLTGAFIAAALGLGALLLSDGVLSRIDAAALIAVWGVSVWHLWRDTSPEDQPELPLQYSGKLVRAAKVIGYLGLVGAGAGAGVYAIVELASVLDLPTYLVSFFAAALGTSAPELFVGITAVRRGQTQLAVGDAFGSSLVDASLSMAVGPLLVPNIIDAGLAVRGSLITLAAVVVVSALLFFRGRLEQWTGGLLVLLYLALLPALIL